MTTEHAIGQGAAAAGNHLIFQQLEDYAWASDAEFQSGLQAILGTNPAPEQAEQLTLRARCFYLSRKINIPIDFNAYKSWRSHNSSAPLVNGMSTHTQASHSDRQDEETDSSMFDSIVPASSSSSTTDPPAPYPISFSQIVELITTGQPIPGIKEVPDTLLEGQASQATTAKRKKPWEKDTTENVDSGSGMGSTTIGVT